jgi:hypothetical protein
MTLLDCTCKCLTCRRMPGSSRPVCVDVKGKQSLEQLGLAIKMLLADPVARNLFAAVFE